MGIYNDLPPGAVVPNKDFGRIKTDTCLVIRIVVLQECTVQVQANWRYCYNSDKLPP